MKKKKILLISGAVVIVAAAAAAIALQSGVSAETETVSKGKVDQYIEDTALVKCKGSQNIYIEGSGKITSVNFDVGASVKAGDLLLSMDKSDYELQLKDADAKIKAAQSQLEGADAKNYADKITAAQSAIEQGQVALDAASRNFESSKKLYESGVISKEELDRSEDAYKTASSALKTSTAQLDEIKNGAPDYLREGYVSQLEQALIYKDGIAKNMKKQELISPANGIILERNVESGSSGAAGTLAFIIGNVQDMELEANILSDESYKVKVGDEVEITGQSIGGVALKGKVSKIAPSAKIITSTLGVDQSRVPVTIQITGDKGLLKPGYNVDIKIITSSKQDTVKVPDSAVFDYNDKTCVFVLKDKKAVLREVKKGLEGDREVEIVEGLKEGEVILVRPDNNIKEGAKIKPLKK